VSVAHDASEIARGVVRDTSTQNNRLSILLFEQFQHLLEREGATDVGVQNEEAVRTTFEDGITEMVETTGGAEGLVFAQVADADVRVGA
jgi:hypothetical protein